MRFLSVTFLFISLARPEPLAAACIDGSQAGGAKYRICLPDGVWNRQLIVYAHGYVSTDQPIAIPEDQLKLPDGTSLPGSFNALGYAFAVSSYRSNGLAVLDGLNDLKELTGIFNRQFGSPTSIFLGGVSEGGLVAALAAEQIPNTYDAAIAACGPIGSFPGQINYIGDIRLLFDYFFPGILPGTVTSVPTQLFTKWDTVYVPAIKAALASDSANKRNFIASSFIPTAPEGTLTIDNVIDALRYSAMATNDAQSKLKGQPYDNHDRFYFGTTNDFELNARIRRITADPAALQTMKSYETTGRPQIPLVTIHTTADPVVPSLHEFSYYYKTLQSGSIRNLSVIPVFRNGHCNFEGGEILWAFLVMLAQRQGSSPKTILRDLTDRQRSQLPAEIRRRLESDINPAIGFSR